MRGTNKSQTGPSPWRVLSPSSAQVQTAINPLSRLLLAAVLLDFSRRAHLASLRVLHGVASNVQAVFTFGCGGGREKAAFRAASRSQDG